VPVPFPALLLVADDHEIVRHGLRSVLDPEPDLSVVAEAEDGVEAVARAGGVDLAILDVAMPRLTGLQAARQIAQLHPEVRVLLLSMYDREQYVREAVEAGAAGYVLKQQADREIVDACRAALRGAPFVYPGSMRRRVAAESNGSLTEREREVVKLIAEGLTAQEIAEVLVVSPKTVDRHRANILGKLGLHKTAQLTRYAVREGLVEP